MNERYELTDTVLSAISGMPGYLLLVLIVYRLRGVSNIGVDLLTRISGKSEATVRNGLDRLRHHGLVDQSTRYNGWHLTAGALQLPLMSYLEDGSLPPPPQLSRKNCDSRELESPPTDAAHTVITVESQNLRLPLDPPSQIESQNFTLNCDGSPGEAENEAGVAIFYTPSQIESQNLRLEMVSLSCCLTSPDINEEQQQPRLTLLRELITAEVSEEVAQAMVERYPPERIQHALDVYSWARRAKKRNGQLYAEGPGYLVNFLTHDWQTPRGWVPAAERCPHCNRRMTDHAYDCALFRAAHERADLHESPCPTPAIAAGPAVSQEGSLSEPDPALAQPWRMALDQLSCSDLPRGHFESLVRPLVPLYRQDGAIVIGAANTYTRDWVDQRLGRTLNHLMTGILSEPVTVRVIVDPDFARHAAGV